MLLPSCQWHSFFGSSPSGAGLLRSCTCTWCWIRSSLGSFLSKCPTKTLSYRQILFASSSSFCLFIDKQGITTSIRDVTCFGQTWVLLVRTCMARHRRTHTSRWLLHQCSVSMCRTWGLACLVISTSANCLLMYHLDVQVLVEPSWEPRERKVTGTRRSHRGAYMQIVQQGLFSYAPMFWQPCFFLFRHHHHHLDVSVKKSEFSFSAILFVFVA